MLGVMMVLLAGLLTHVVGAHVLTVEILARPIAMPWSLLVVGAAVSLGVFFSLDVTWPWDPDDPMQDSNEHS